MANVTEIGGDVTHDRTSYARGQMLQALRPRAQSRYNGYREKKLEAEAMLRHLRERGEELGQRLYMLTHNLSAAKQNNGAVDFYEKQASAAQAEFDAVAAKRSKLDAQRTIYTGVLSRLDQYLNDRAAGMWRGPRYDGDATPPVAALRKNESYGDALRRCQDEVAALDLQLTQVRNAPPPAQELRELIVTKLAALASALGHRWTTNPVTGEQELRLVAPDLSDWASATNVEGMLTGYFMLASSPR